MNSPAPSTPPACLGLIVPPREGEVPGDGPALYGGRVRFLARGLGLGEISPRGYEEVIDRVVGLAAELGRAGATAVSLMGTSLSFFRGAAFNAELEAEMARRTGLPCTTMSHAIVRGLAAVGVRRVAVARALAGGPRIKLTSGRGRRRARRHDLPALTPPPPTHG